MQPQPKDRVNILNFIRVERKVIEKKVVIQKEEKSLPYYLKKIIEMLPLLSIFLLITSFISIQIYYSAFSFQPLQHFSFSELFVLMFQNLSVPIGKPLLFLIGISSGMLMIEYFRMKKNKLYLLIPVIFLFGFLCLFISLIYLDFSYYPLIKIKGNFFSEEYELYAFLALSIIVFFGGSTFYSGSTKNVFNIIYPLYIAFVMLTYSCMFFYYDSNGLKTHRLNRNVNLKTKYEEIVPYNIYRYVIGNTADKYFVYDVRSRSTEIISSGDIERVIFFEKFCWHKWLVKERSIKYW